MKYSMKEKALMCALSIVGLFTSIIDWPICFAIAGACAAKYGNVLTYLVGAFNYLGYGVAGRAMYISAMVAAPINRKKSDEFYEWAREYHKKVMGFTDSIVDSVRRK